MNTDTAGHRREHRAFLANNGTNSRRVTPAVNSSQELPAVSESSAARDAAFGLAIILACILVALIRRPR